MRVHVSPDAPQLVAIQLIPPHQGGYFCVSNLLGTTGIPENTEVRLYAPAQAAYASEQFVSGAWTPNTNPLALGQGIWILCPTSHVFLIAGMAPDRLTAPTATVTLVEGMQLVGCPYPFGMTNTSALWGAAAEGDLLLKVDGDGFPAEDGGALTNAAAGYYGSGPGWQPGASLDMMEAFWYRSYSNRDWRVTKPYIYP